MANRVEIPIVVLNNEAPYNPVEGATAVVTLRGGGSADVFQDSGATNNKVIQPLSTDKSGRLTGWLDRGAYEVAITIPGKTPYSEFLDVAPATDQAVTTTWIADGAITEPKVSAAIKDATAGTPSLRTLGTSSTQATAGNDSRLSNTRTPTDGTVTTAKIVDANVTTAKIADGNVTLSKLASSAQPFKWYTPKVIATEQSTSSASYTTLSTPDEIKDIVVPTNGFLFIGYLATVKCSVFAAGRASLFINSEQPVLGLQSPPPVQESFTFPSNSGGVDKYTGYLYTTSSGLVSSTGGTEVIPSSAPKIFSGGQDNISIGMTRLLVPAGTYTVNVRFKTSSGTATVKDRTLWVATFGV